ncbi:MAG: nucleotidyltransferase [Prevotella sp.]|jgi:dTDP-glucose pyrophosphorylase|nr:nucleotidyltransferase [Prevotella sp.]
MKPTLFILAAGMGSRYGGLKQLDGVGPNGETIMDYSVYDAIRSGFGKIVFVIRHSFEKEFKEKIVSKYDKIIQVELVYQELEYLPDGFTLNPDREKPWGTNHALLMGKDVIKEPFAIINADDFYGRASFELLAGQLKNMGDKKYSYCMIGYLLGYTLSDSGTVARGVCEIDEDSYLTKIAERTNIENVDGVPCFRDEQGNKINLSNSAPVSMNMWGFTPDYFDLSEDAFIDFMGENSGNLKAEFLIPTLVNTLVEQGKIKVKLINTPARWFGVTYVKDKPEVVRKIQELIEDRVYPEKLFE